MVNLVDRDSLRELLEAVAAGSLSAEEALRALARWPYADLGYARVDHHRHLRHGSGEVIYAPGKTPEQIVAIARELLPYPPVLITRLFPEALGVLRQAFGADLHYHEAPRLAVVGEMPDISRRGEILILSAGTADQAVAEEAALVARALGNPVRQIQDVGVAGLHRLLDVLPHLETARVVIVVAGMDGALPSVVGGLTDKPVLAVPTSAGYGANFQGLSALLTMLNSCAPGVGVLNIDNGFGAARLADAINRAAESA